MVGKRERRHGCMRWLRNMFIVLLAVGILLPLGGEFSAAEERNDVQPETTPEQSDGLLPPDAPEEISPASPEEELPTPSEQEDVPEQEAPQLDPEKPMVALTFDDGPGAYTERLLDILAQNNAKATFFVVGKNIEGYRETLKRAADEGHEIGSHSWSHPQLTKLSREVISEQMNKTRDKIQEVTGTVPTLLRPPYGSQNQTVRELAAELDTVLINWNVDPRDWKLRNADKVYDAVMSTAGDGDIILCHDIHETTVDAMERLIPDLQAQGFQLVTVTELLTSRGAELIAGTQYRNRPES